MSGVLIKECNDCGHWHGRLTKRCLRPGCRCHERANVKVNLDGFPLRPAKGSCPSCGVAEIAYCSDDCNLIDPAGPR